MDNMESQYGQRVIATDLSAKYSVEGASRQRIGASGITVTHVSESNLRGLDLIGATAATVMMLAPLAAVAIG